MVVRAKGAGECGGEGAGGRGREVYGSEVRAVSWAYLVGRLAVDYLIRAQPLPRHGDVPRQHTLNVVDVIELRSEGVIGRDADHLPVCLTVVDHGKAAEHLDEGEG